MRRMVSCVLLAAMLAGSAETASAEQTVIKDAWENAMETPYGRYPDTVTFTMGKMINDAYSGMPKNDTYEDNAYTRYLEEKLNVRMELTLVDDSTTYGVAEKVAVTNGEMPDIMVIDDADLLKKMVDYDMVEDLSPYFETCMTERLREIYGSYGNDFFSTVTFDGGVYGIPSTDIYSGANFIWLRKDWMDKLGLDDPQNLSDVKEIIRQFIEKDPGGNGAGKTVGLLCDRSMMANTSQCFNLVPVFTEYDSWPGIWVENEEGTIAYGSILPETKEALKEVRAWYEEGILDREFLIRTVRNNASLIEEGKSGSFFGWWWAPNNPLQMAVENDPDAVWQPYLLSNMPDGSVLTYVPYAAEKYVVVRKGYKHPELVMKVLSMLFDYARYEDKEAEEISDYFARGVDPSVTPFVINCDYSDAVERTTEHLRKALEGELGREELNTLEKGYYEACISYLSGGEVKAADWAAYTSRFTAVDLQRKSNIRYINQDYSKGFENLISTELKEYENECMLQIIMGIKPLSAFDEWIQQWYARGGAEATEEAKKIYQKKNNNS